MRTGVKAAIITALAVILAAVIAKIDPSLWRHDPADRSTFTIAGTVVDEASNVGIGQALVTIVGRPETYVTEDGGNFRISLKSPPPADGNVRLQVNKSGYLPWDRSTGPAEDLRVQLRRK